LRFIADKFPARVLLMAGFSLRKPDLGWLARQLRTLGALAIMGIGMMLGQISGHFLHTLLA